jgi:hypothetical protein
VIGYGGTDLIVAERWQYVLRKINLLTTYVSVFSGVANTPGNVQGTATASRWNNPLTITYNNMRKEYYVAEAAPAYRVRKVQLDGSSAFFAGTHFTAGGTDGYYGTGTLADPWHIATVEATSLIFLADGSGHTLRTISAAGLLQTVVGQYTVSGAIDGTGTAVRLDNPRGLAMYHSGRFMFLSENAAAGSARIRRVTWRSGQYVVTTVVGVTAQTTASVPAIQSAWSLCLHPSGTVLAITGSHFVGAVDIVVPTALAYHGEGAVSLFVGGPTSGTADGRGAASGLAVLSMTFDRQGTIYLGDTSGVRTIDRTGQVFTLIPGGGSTNRGRGARCCPML